MNNTSEKAKSNDIILIPAEQLHSHPDNPRKELGELTELSESIKKKGVMQNLSVIPGHWDEKKNWHEKDYTILIGHRRFSAGKLAGVTEFPCRIISDMDQKEQIGTMLEENMQRNDLTIWEQANGFQMMFDLGDSAEQIAEKTGFSQTTIRRRLNIAKLDSKVLQKKEKDEEFQLSLNDLYELEKIKDIKTRNKLLREARDSRDLVWKTKQAVTAEIREKNKKEFIELFKKAGIKAAPKKAENEKYCGKWDILQAWELDKKAPKRLKKFTEDNIQWVSFYQNEIAVVAPAKKKKRELSEYELKAKEKAKAKKELKQKHKELYKKIDDFLMGIITKEIAPLKEDVELYRTLISTMIKSNVDFYRSNLAEFYSGETLFDLEHKNPEKYQEFKEWEKNLSVLHRAIAHMTSIKKCEMYNYNADYSADGAGKVMAVIEFLSLYGFSVSEDEQKMLNGTHELYIRD